MYNIQISYSTPTTFSLLPTEEKPGLLVRKILPAIPQSPVIKSTCMQFINLGVNNETTPIKNPRIRLDTKQKILLLKKLRKRFSSEISSRIVPGKNSGEPCRIIKVDIGKIAEETSLAKSSVYSFYFSRKASLLPCFFQSNPVMIELYPSKTVFYKGDILPDTQEHVWQTQAEISEKNRLPRQKSEAKTSNIFESFQNQTNMNTLSSTNSESQTSESDFQSLPSFSDLNNELRNGAQIVNKSFEILNRSPLNLNLNSPIPLNGLNPEPFKNLNGRVQNFQPPSLFHIQEKPNNNL